jgi:hypothetical protein
MQALGRGVSTGAVGPGFAPAEAVAERLYGLVEITLWTTPSTPFGSTKLAFG